MPFRVNKICSSSSLPTFSSSVSCCKRKFRASNGVGVYPALPSWEPSPRCIACWGPLSTVHAHTDTCTHKHTLRPHSLTITHTSTNAHLCTTPNRHVHTDTTNKQAKTGPLINRVTLSLSVSLTHHTHTSRTQTDTHHTYTHTPTTHSHRTPHTHTTHTARTWFLMGVT